MLTPALTLALCLAATDTIPSSVAVRSFDSKGGLTDEQGESLGDLLVNLIRATGVTTVMSMADIREALELSQQKQLLGCNEGDCLVELSDVLGVRWMIVGNASQFSGTWLINLKLVDSKDPTAGRGVSRTVVGGADKIVMELPGAVRELLTGVHEIHDDGGLLFTRRRAGSVPISLTLDLWSQIPPHRTNEDQYPVAHARLRPLSEIYSGAVLKALIGYVWLDWLTFAARVDLNLGLEIESGNRSLVNLAGGVEIQGMLPLNFSFSPIFFIAGTLGRAWDSEANGNESFDMSTGTLEIGFGAQTYFRENWFIAGRLAAVETVYFGIHDRSGQRLRSQMLGTSIRLQLTVGYEL